MLSRIVWTRRAIRDFDAIYSYYQENVSLIVADKFFEKTYFFLEKIKAQPERGRLVIDTKGIRVIKIAKHIQLFYRIEGKILVVSAFFDTRQNPLKRPF
jgi:addiction module RelE/StbE family toxin